MQKVRGPLLAVGVKYMFLDTHQVLILSLFKM